MSTAGATGVRPALKDSTEPDSAATSCRSRVGQHLVELGQRPQGGVAGAGDRAASAGEQRDRGDDRLLVVEKQGGRSCPGPSW